MPSPPAARTRRPYAARVPEEQRRTELLDAALHLVVTAGHPAVTMAAVAEQAGVTKPVVYSAFENRVALLGALLHREQEAALAQLAEAVPPTLQLADAQEVAAALPDVLVAFLHAVRDAPQRWQCIVAQLPDMPAEFHHARDEARRSVLDQIRWWAERSLRTSAGTEIDAELVAHALVAGFEMAARLVLAEPERFHPERFAETLTAVVGWRLPRPGHR